MQEVRGERVAADRDGEEGAVKELKGRGRGRLVS